MTSFGSIQAKVVRLLILCDLLIASVACYPQPTFTIQLQGDIDSSGHERRDDRTAINFLESLRKVDSIAHTSGVGRCFAGIYFKVMQRIAIQIETRDEAEKKFIIRFED